MLHIYNNLTKEKEAFTPIQPGKVGIYVCGITVYDYCHIGHARLSVAFDLIVRYLRARGYEVTYVRNITDIDDKIIKRAQENNEDINVLTERFIQAMYEDEEALFVLKPDIIPRATQYIPAMIAIIEKLLAKGHAYIAENGDVNYQVGTFAAYGQLAQQDIEKLRAGARVDILDSKRDPLDFVLWKMSKPGEPSWDSPWGKGRPGWHIECSAMSSEILGKHFDIHGGGMDLIFPHHQNEIAQSEGAFGCKSVNIWMHNGFVTVNREKMSKSLNNFFTIRDVLKEYQPEVVRYFLIASHYRSPINYSLENLSSAQAALERFYTCLRGLPLSEPKLSENTFVSKFFAAMDDDFNTPVALSILFDLVREINRLREESRLDLAAELGAVLIYLANILGILQQQPEAFLQRCITEQEKMKIERIIDARNEARRNRNWHEADRLRAELSDLGVILEDTAEGTVWRRELN